MENSYNRTSTAYDFSLFDTSLRKPQVKTEEKPELQVVTVSAAKKGRPVAIAVVAALFGILLMAFIFCKAAVSEANLNVSLRQNVLEETKAMNAALSAELNGSVSLEQVEQYAKDELGMQKVVNAQEKYVEMDTGALIETKKDTDDNIFVGISKWFRGVAEYLGF